MPPNSSLMHNPHTSASLPGKKHHFQNYQHLIRLYDLRGKITDLRGKKPNSTATDQISNQTNLTFKPHLQNSSYNPRNVTCMHGDRSRHWTRRNANARHDLCTCGFPSSPAITKIITLGSKIRNPNRGKGRSETPTLAGARRAANAALNLKRAPILEHHRRNLNFASPAGIAALVLLCILHLRRPPTLVFFLFQGLDYHTQCAALCFACFLCACWSFW